MFAASLIDNWEYITRACQYWSAIRWWEPKVARFFLRVSGREQVAWTLAFASVVVGKKFDDPYLEPLIEMIEQGKIKREQWLWRFLQAIAIGNEIDISEAADDYFTFYLKRESGRNDLGKKFMLEGTLLVNFARYRGYDLSIPDCIGERYVQL